MRKFFSFKIFIGFICGAIFAISTEIAFGIPARVPIIIDYAVPIQYKVTGHHHGS